MITNILLLLNSIFYLVPSLMDGNLDPTTLPPNASPNYYRLMNMGGFIKSAFDSGEYYRLVSSMFLHWGLVHFIFNMISLYQLGPFAEDLYGGNKMLLIYLISGIVGSLANYFFSGPLTNSAGASGAIFGLVGALIAYFIFNQTSSSSYVLSQLFIVVGINFFYGYMNEHISNAAHIGGLFGGFIVGLIFTMI